MCTTGHIYTWNGSCHLLFPKTSQRHVTLCVSSRRLIRKGQKARSERQNCNVPEGMLPPDEQALCQIEAHDNRERDGHIRATGEDEEKLSA